MNANFIVGLGEQVLWMVVKLAGPLLLASLVVGLAVSVFQATTQLQEPTLAFVPKIIAVMAALVVLGPWMLVTLTDFARQILGNLTSFIQ
ncbi:MAG: flagellar biosynthesis protein FliQ [Alicyclobacillaceae bacterium]|nr:flagellar biosynthesis protein FliQ [Alicyclobacillaceae bacterium]